MEDRKYERPAFPSEAAAGEWRSGMTLRDYFAAKAMQGTLSNTKMNYPNSKKDLESLAEISYIIADAMLNQREK